MEGLLVNSSVFLEGVIYEVVAVTFSGGVHVAPIGVRRRGEFFEATIYHDTSTYRNLRLNPRLTFNSVRSGLLFYESMYLKGSVPTANTGDYWFLEDAEFWVGARVFGETPSVGKSVFMFEETVFQEGRVSLRPYSRADAALIEMLVHSSRIEPFMREGLVDDAKELYRLIKHYYELVSRVAPNTKYQSYAKAIYEDAGKRMGV